MRIYSTLFLFLSILLLTISCKDDDQNTNSQDESLAQLRMDIAEHTADNMISTALVAFNQEIETLQQSVENFSQDTDLEALSILRSSLINAWTAWQYVSIYAYGPVEDTAMERIMNTYPADGDKIESNISEEIFALNNISNFDASGFPSIDYLLNAYDNATTLSKFQNNPNRMAYLSTIVSLMQATTTTVQNDFSSGTFIDNFTSTNSDGMDVGSALGIIMNTIDIHFQRTVRDAKVAIPAGVRSAGVVRPTNTEALYAGQSKTLLLSALQAYQALFNGTDRNNTTGASLYDYLEAINQTPLAEESRTLFTEAIELANDLEEDFTVQIEADNQKLVDLFLHLQNMVTLVKSDMVSVMGITLTNQDNDGD